MFELRKVSIVKRASAWLLDVILLAVLATGSIFVISLICNFNHHREVYAQYNSEWTQFRREYVGDVAEFYGFIYEETDEEGNHYTITKDGKPASLGDVMKALDDSKGEDPETASAYATYQTLTPAAKVNAQFKFILSLLFMMISLGILFAYLILEFIVPMFLKNGKTVGKAVFGICIVRPDCVKITSMALFARTLLGKFAIETMFPVFLIYLFFFGGLGILAIILLAAFLLMNLILLLATKNRTPIHDLLAGTVAVDARLQVIYASEEELVAKKSEQHKQFIENSKS